MTRPEYVLSPEQLDGFRRDGFLHLPAVIDTKWLERGRAACAHVEPVPTIEGSYAPEYFMKLRVWERHPVFEHFCKHSPCPAIAAQLVDSSRINLLYDQMFSIEPGSGDRTDFHNDLPYWPIRGTQVVTMWLTFDRVLEENGALEFIRGSHRWRQRYQPYNSGRGENEPFPSGGDSQDLPMPDWETERDKHDFVTVETEPGDAVAFHALTVHGSHANVSENMRRRAYAMRFTGDDVRYYDGPVWNVYIVNPKLRSGDRLDSEQYPVVFDAG